MMNRSERFLLLLLAISGMLWLGGLTSRTIIANEFFIAGTLDYDPGITVEQEIILFQLIAATSIFVSVCYLIVLVSGILVLRKTRMKFKSNGWLLMSAILFFLFVPVEVFTGYLDVKFILAWFHAKDVYLLQGIIAYDAYSTFLRETLSHRIGALSGVPVIAILCYFTIVALIVLRPLISTNASVTPNDP